MREGSLQMQAPFENLYKFTLSNQKTDPITLINRPPLLPIVDISR
jgi:hypothetical protein